jgi:amino acid permease
VCFPKVSIYPHNNIIILDLLFLHKRGTGRKEMLYKYSSIILTAHILSVCVNCVMGYFHDMNFPLEYSTLNKHNHFETILHPESVCKQFNVLLFSFTASKGLQ